MTKTIYTEAQAALCEAITVARKDAGLSQMEMAAKLNCHQSMIARVESGQRRIDVIELIIIARAIGVDPYEIIGGLWDKVPEGQGL